MAKRINNIFPKLRGLMAEQNESIKDICSLLKISDDVLRRTLKGNREFKLAEVIVLSNHYNVAITELFIKDSD